MRIKVLALFIGMMLFSSIEIYAQDDPPPQTLIVYPEVVANGSALDLSLYFTLTDSAGHATSDTIQAATIVLDNGDRYEATVERPTTPIYIVLVLDASGSMSSAAADMKTAAISLIENAPPEAQFAVLRFNDQIEVLETFTADRSRLINAINQVNPVNLRGTCLYDAAYRATELLTTAPKGRRAVIMFTDGKDEVYNSTLPCSTHRYDDVMARATAADLRVPINTIGLRGTPNQLNETELRNMASSTGGLSAIGAQSNLPGLFQQIVDGLKNQWLARATVYPSIGLNNAMLIVTLGEGTFAQPGATAFNSPIDAPRMATPVAVADTTTACAAIKAIRVDTDTSELVLDVSVPDPALVQEYNFELVAAHSDGTLPRIFVIPSPLAVPVRLPIADLPSGSYEVMVSTYDSSGTRLCRQGIEISYESPLEVVTEVAIDAVSQDNEAKSFIVSVRTENVSNIDHYEVDFLDQNNTPVLSASPSAPLTNNKMYILFEKLRAGDYTVELRAVDEFGNLLAEAQPTVVHFTPPPKNTEEAEGESKDTLWLIPVIFVIVLGSASTLGWVLWRTRQSKTNFYRDGTMRPKMAPRPRFSPPTPRLTVTQSSDSRLLGQTVTLDHFPFTLGRRGRDLSLDGDQNVSRMHATILYENGVFLLRDDGSTLGTQVNHTRISPHATIPLVPGSVIELGTTTILTFGLGLDPDKTNFAP